MPRRSPEAGHRQRLRDCFLADRGGMVTEDLLELLLTFAIPRRDLAPVARDLLQRFGTVHNVTHASHSDLMAVEGVGPNAALLLRLVAQLSDAMCLATSAACGLLEQSTLFGSGPEDGQPFKGSPSSAPTAMRTFANDEVANSLQFLPQAARFDTVNAFRTFLQQRLPYNSEATRRRRAKYIVDRFLPEGRIDVPLVYHASQCTVTDDLKPVLFYHMLRAEPLAAAIAEELIWPALPLGSVDRQQIREAILRHLPELSSSSQAKVLQSIFNTYALLGVARRDGDVLRLRVRPGTLASFNYLLAAEFPRPGVYTFDELEIGRLRRWLLWDRAWMTQQLYHLEQLGILAKVSQIDTVRQFTVQFDQAAALRVFCQHPLRAQFAVRETAELADVDPETP